MRVRKSTVFVAVRDEQGMIKLVETRAKKVRVSRRGWVTTIIYENGVVRKIPLKIFIEAIGDRTKAVREYAWIVKELSGVEGIDKKILNKLLP